MPDVRGTKTCREVTVLPGMIEMVVNIIWPGVVADPVVVIHVRRIGMAGLICEVAICLRRWRGTVEGLWTMHGRGAMGSSSAVLLGRDRRGENEQRYNDE
jgi:hypothetical protein